MKKQNVLIRDKKNKVIQLYQNQQFEQAKTLLTEICTRDENDHESLYMLGTINAQTGAFIEAEAELKKAITIQPKFFQAYDILGTVLFNLDRKEEAVDIFKKSIAIEDSNFVGHYNLGNVLKEISSFEDAIISYKKAISINPNISDAYNNIALVYYILNDCENAIENFLICIKLNPNQPKVFKSLSKTYFKHGDIGNTVKACESMINLEPDNPKYHYNLARYRNIQGYDHLTQQCCLTAIKLKPDYIKALDLLGIAYLRQGLLNKAEECYVKIRSIDENTPHAPVGMASIDIKNGRYNDAYNHLQPLITNKSLTVHAAFLLGNIAKHTKKYDEAEKALYYILDNKIATYNDELKHINFALAELYDQKSNYNKAYEHFEIANNYNTRKYDITEHTNLTNGMVEKINRDILNVIPHSDSVAAPVFIIGMNRSGTSLIEQIISSHPDVYGAGELELILNISNNLIKFSNHQNGFPDCIKTYTKEMLNTAANDYLKYTNSLTSNEKFVTDKLPHNFWHLPTIELIFPKAIIIHCKRNPIDTCLSNYFQDFGSMHNQTNNLKDLGNYYLLYNKIMAHWNKHINLKILNINYEDLVANQETVSKEIINFCNLSWDDACLNFHKSKRLVVTASSDQVKQPMHTKSVARWKNYEDHVGILKELFDQNQIEY